MSTTSKREKLLQGVNYAALLLAGLICLFPFFYVLSVSFTPAAEVVRRGVVLIPEQITLYAYNQVLQGYGLGNAYQVTLFRTLVGTGLNLVFTILMAYALSKKSLPGRAPLLMIVIFTMLFNGGLIPTYLLTRYLGLLDTVWALIVPGLISAFNLIIVKGFFEQLPQEIEESAKVDGAGDMRVLWRIVLPLSMPVIATIGLFYAVFHWNSYFDGIMYIRDQQLYPLQVVLRNILLNFQTQTADAVSDTTLPASFLSIQMAAVMLSTVPILLVYPFLQRHFAKGVLLGSVKG
ncbi:carbohydrate ABC transporter permease [Paenibacillus sp. IB182496]|uniref:Carbohydrate ABC transporter permease n=1 Tax=Paenibacillus sabuli TaxID=2772509 RepID=A0A927BWL8_9BACL|nr:carbohydrate ABC transporter permease [Paenibacillus sabuli]MBD2847672.1 carbohydrate ABC transporter permease [Paenibacillus sabuli]